MLANVTARGSIGMICALLLVAFATPPVLADGPQEGGDAWQSVRVSSTPAMVGPGGTLVPHADLDFQSQWEWPAGIRRILDQLQAAVALLEKDPSVTFALSSPAVYDVVARYDPALFAALLGHLEQGSIQPVGGRWCEAETQLISAESHARQLLHGQRYFLQKFGRHATVGWEPRTPGFPATVPQILKRAGIGQIYLSAPEVDSESFWWEGLDGSRVFVINADRPAADEKLSCVSAAQAFAQALRADPASIPQHHGAIQADQTARFTTRGHMKHLNRETEAALVTAETIAAIASLSGFLYPAADLTGLWKDLCWAQQHDTLGGACIPESYEYTRMLLSRAIDEARWITRASLRHIAARVPPADGTSPNGAPAAEGYGILVANPLGWLRSGIVALPLDQRLDGRSRFTVTRSDGRETSWQIANTRQASTLLFWAEDVPAFGYDTYHVRPLAPAASPAPHAAPAGLDSVTYRTTDEGVVLESGWVRLLIDRNTGQIASITDHANGREVLSGGRRGNVFELWTDPARPAGGPGGGAPDGVTIVDNRVDTTVTNLGPLQVRVRVNWRGEDLRIQQFVIVTAGTPRIDFETTVNWKRRGGDPRLAPILRTAFPLTPAGTGTARYAVPFGHVVQETTGRDVPALAWGSLSGSNGGAAILNGSKHGCSAAADGTLRLTLVGVAPALDPEANRGFHRFTYSLLPLRPDAPSASITRAAFELHMPLLAERLPSPARPTPRTKDALPNRFACVELTNLERVVPTCFKRAEDGTGLVMRLYLDDAEPAVGLVTANFPVTSVEQVNLLESKIKTSPSEARGAGLAFPIGLHGFEIRTCKFIPSEP